MTDLDAIRARHVPTLPPDKDGRGIADSAFDICGHDSDIWPCDTAIVLAALDECDAALGPTGRRVVSLVTQLDAAEEREARLRAAAQDAEMHMYPGRFRQALRDALATTPEGE